jgi:anti-sigma regulatory factor (Ser/Thr protein kinase)
MISTPTSRCTSLGTSPATAGVARRYVRRVLGGQCVNDKVTGVVELLTSEVVTNALLHARSVGELAVYVSDTTIRVEVEDPSSLMPARRQGGVEAVSGRGLNIVDRLAAAWGVEPGRRGKRVWFEVDRGKDSPAPRSGSSWAWDDRNSQNSPAADAPTWIPIASAPSSSHESPPGQRAGRGRSRPTISPDTIPRKKRTSPTSTPSPAA